MTVRIELEEVDARALVEVLEVHLTEFRREVAGTENPEYRHALQRRQTVLERLVGDLRQQVAGRRTSSA